MLIHDSKTLLTAYRWIEKNCDLIDEFVYKHAVNFGPSPEFCSTYDVTSNIIDLIERKNRLINLKLMIDDLINGLELQDKKILLAKIRYNLTMENFCKLMSIPSMRTGFRQINKALEHFTMRANSSPYKEKLEHILDSEYWIANIRRNLNDNKVCV